MSEETRMTPDQSATVPYRIGPEGTEVLLVTSRSRRWIVPKGSIEADIGAYGTADLEASEEAGVVRRVETNAIDFYRHGTERET